MSPTITVHHLAHERRSPGFVEATVFAGEHTVLDPFLAFTDFHMSEPTFAPHPHAGFSAVTYMFRDSAGSFTNQDSLGDVSTIGPGALHWTQAARGMMHEEIPVRRGDDCHGLQMFVKLAAAHEQAEPRAFHVDADQVPVITPGDGAEVRVVVGEYGGVGSPVRGATGLLTPITLLDVDLAAGAVVDLTVPATDRAVVLLVTGSAELHGAELHGADPSGADPSGVDLTAVDLAVLDPGPGRVRLGATAEGATALVLWGTPIGEPVVFGGPFAVTNHDDLLAAQQRYRRGEMGSLAPSF